MKNIFLFSLLFLFLFSSLKCNPRDEKLDEQKLKEHLINANRIMVKDERQEIEEFLTHHNWNMDSTGTGLRYMIYENGTGNKILMNDSVALSGKIFLLDATLCMEYKKESPLKFYIGHKDVARGLEEAALLMKEGDKGRFVIPAHLAYGLLEDSDKIPGSTALYAELELLNVNSTFEK
ncbi:MAG TPA: FKBP-type peptidyl-prolyl cis-trans isomerase [Bacteroidia bacterium]|nr:FKBP-type peptidyl-prolyl cis-trans isomerase [Bacteroidia bacterium]